MTEPPEDRPDYQGYPGGPYPSSYAYGYPPQPGTNTMAILALVFAFVCAPAAIVFGILARNQIRRSREQGWGLATAGLVLGIVFTVISALLIIAMFVIIGVAAHHADDSNGAGASVLYAARAYFGR